MVSKMERIIMDINVVSFFALAGSRRARFVEWSALMYWYRAFFIRDGACAE